MNLLNFQLLLSSDILTNFVDNMDVYFIMIVALAFLAVGDLVVEVHDVGLEVDERGLANFVHRHHVVDGEVV